MPTVEISEPWNKPVCRECRQHADSECALRPPVHLFDTAHDAVHGMAHCRSKSATWFGQLHAAILPVEQRDTQLTLQRLDLVADRPVRQMQFVGRPREVLMPRRRFEGAQRGQRWQVL